MIKTQVSVPDKLYKRAKEIAESQEWSLAEVFRRGLEEMDRAYPAQYKKDKDRKLPVLPAGSFRHDFDQTDWSEMEKDSEMRGIENVGD